MNKKTISVEAIINKFDDSIIEVKGNYSGVSVDNVADPQHTTASTLDWVNSTKTNKQIIAESTIAKVVIVDEAVEYSEICKNQNKVFLVVSKPRMFMAKVIGEFFIEKVEGFIHPRATIDADAIISPTAHISAGCVVGKAIIGDGTLLKPNVVVSDNVRIGKNCLIQAGAVIGTDGLGCSREADGTLVKFPHLGGIIIGDNVEIGANCQVAKGVLSDTIIGNGCKINGLSFIAHNCVLEENVWITGDTMLCGTTHVKKNSTIFSNVIIRDQTTIGEKATVGMGSVVTKNIPDGEVWFGAPAHKKD